VYPRNFTCMHADTAGSCMYPCHQTVLWATAKCPQKASGCCGRVVGIPAPPHLHLEAQPSHVMEMRQLALH